MGVYVDAEDLVQHFRQGGSLGEETVEEIMQEQESYVMSRLRLSELPPNNDILKDIIRSLTIAKGIFAMPAAPVDLVQKAQLMQAEALRRLTELVEEGWTGTGTYRDESNIEEEVYNPHTSVFFTPGDFYIGT